MRIKMGLRCIVVGTLLAGLPGCFDADSTQPKLVQKLHTDHRVGGQLRTVMSFRATAAEDPMVRLDYFEVDCGSGARLSEGLTASAMIRTGSAELTPGIPGLEDLPLDHASKHRYYDHMQTLRPGCFDVIATPVDASGALDARCKPAQRSNVVVELGKTREIVLINQCELLGNGGLDSIVVRNHPPTVEGVSFETTKFGECDQDMVVCATATDVDGDPMRFQWQQLPGAVPSLGSGTTVLQSVSPIPGTRKECVLYRPTALGRYDIKVEVFDLARVDGQLREFSEITEEGHISKGELDFFFYSTPDGANVDNTVVDGQVEKKSGILILASSVDGGQGSQEAIAARAVLDRLRLATPRDAEGNLLPPEPVDVLSESEWSNKSLREFSRYRAIVIGDPDCGDTPPEIPELWSAAVNGNVLIYGSNPSRHGKTKVIEQAIAFASNDETRTGAYLTTSCYYQSAPSGTTMRWINAFGELGPTGADQVGNFDVVHAGVCRNEAEVIASFDVDAQGNELGYTKELLSNWGCSAHNFFQRWPSNFKPLALITDNGLESPITKFPGEPYILARGAYLAGCGNGELEFGEICDDGNRIDGDGCDHSCSLEDCGDGLLQGNEYCDDGNTQNGDGCNSDCELEFGDCGPGIGIESLER